MLDCVKWACLVQSNKLDALNHTHFKVFNKLDCLNYYWFASFNNLDRSNDVQFNRSNLLDGFAFLWKLRFFLNCYSRKGFSSSPDDGHDDSGFGSFIAGQEVKNECHQQELPLLKKPNDSLQKKILIFD